MRDAGQSEARLPEAELAFRQLEQSFRTLFMLHPDPVFSVNPEGRFVLANPASAALSGYSIAELSQKTFTDLCAPDQLAQTVESFKQGLREGIPRKLETAFIRKDGQRLELLVTGVPVVIKQEVSAIFCTAKDISQRKRSEEDLRASEAKFRALFVHAPEAIFLTIPDGRILAANPAACAVFGRTEEELCQVGRDGLVDPEDPRHALAVEERKRTGRIDTELNYLRKNGERFTAQVKSVVLTGEPLSAIVILNDITERKRGEAALRRSEGRFRHLIESLPVGFYATDAEGRVTEWNAAAERLAGRRPAVGDDRWCVSWKLHYPDGRPMPHEECPMALALRSGQAKSGDEIVVERPDGMLAWVMPYPTPLRDDSGKVTGALNVLVDVTERKRTEQTLERSAKRQELLSRTISSLLTAPNPRLLNRL